MSEYEQKGGRPPEAGRAVLAAIPYRARLVELFWAYIKLTALVVGGGYAIIAASDDYFVRKKRWLSEADMLEVIAVTQSVPGILACNSAVCLGLRVAGLGGALAALFGSMIPSIVIIILVAFTLQNVLSPETMQHPRVRGAFIGVIAAILAMVVVTIVKMWRRVMRGPFEYVLTFLCVVAAAVCKVNPGWVVLSSVPVGIAYVWWKRRALLAAAGRRS